MVIVRFEDETEKILNLDFGTFTTKERVLRSLKIFLSFLGAALASILVPVLHFFLVPVFFLLAFASAYLRFKQISFINLAACNCPKCDAKMNEKKVFQTSGRPFSKFYCFECRTNMKFEIASMRLRASQNGAK